MVGQGKFYDYEDITLVRARDDLRIQRKGSASPTGEAKGFFTGVDEIKIAVDGERFRIARPTGKVLVIRGIKEPSGECFRLVIKKEDARLVTQSKFYYPKLRARAESKFLIPKREDD